MDILCCPVCKGDLALTVTAGNKDEILEGNLQCARCKMDYPVTDGIPDLLAPDQR